MDIRRIESFSSTGGVRTCSCHTSSRDNVAIEFINFDAKSTRATLHSNRISFAICQTPSLSERYTLLKLNVP